MFRKAPFAVLFAVLTLIPAADAQIITTAAGSTTWGGPLDVKCDAAGNMYVADYAGHKVYKVDRLASVSTIAGTGTAGFSGDGGLATSAQIYNPTSIAVDTDGTIYIADYNNARIRKIATNGVITTYAGTGRPGFSGDGGPATAAQFNAPLYITLDGAGNLIMVDYNNARLRKITKSTGVINTIAGTGRRGSTGDNGPPLAADIDPASIYVAPDGSIYIANASYRGSPTAPKVRKISANSSSITTVAGSGTRSDNGDGGAALAASFLSIDGLTMDSSGNLYLAESDGARIRKVSASGIVTTYAGTGVNGFAGDDGDAVKARVSRVVGMTIDPSGGLLVADYDNRRIRRIAPAPLPALSPSDFALPSFLGKTNFSSNTYLELYGTNLAQTTRQWAGSDFNGSNAPTTLDGVSVKINGKPAYIFYISPTQININTPDDTATGPVSIQITNTLGASNIQTVTRARISPALQTVPQFSVGGKQYVVALTPDFTTFIGRPNMIAGVAFVAARPGSTISIYALGCGPTNPPTQAGVIAAQGAPLASSYELKIGGVPATVTFAGVVAGSIGLYQFNVVVPNVPAGDQPIELMVDGVANAQNLSIVIGQ